MENKKQVYVIVYDEHDDWAGECCNLETSFDGTWQELQQYIKDMRKDGCYNISATSITD